MQKVLDDYRVGSSVEQISTLMLILDQSAPLTRIGRNEI